jgi:hypothetical protein
MPEVLRRNGIGDAAEGIVQTVQQLLQFRPATGGVHIDQFFGPTPAQGALQVLEPALRP